MKQNMKLVIAVLFAFVSVLRAEDDVFMSIYFGNAENVTIKVGDQDQVDVNVTVYHNGNQRKAGVVKIHSSTPVTTIPKKILTSYPNLEFFEASNNKIKKIEQESFELMPNLRVLNLDRNVIKYLPGKVFSGSYKLFSILLQNNSIEKIFPRAFEGLRELFSLRLSHNKIKRLLPKTFIGTPKLITLDLFGNEIEEIHPLTFYGLDGLTVLILDYNKLKILPSNVFDHFKKDYHIFLTYNQIVGFSREIFKRLDDKKSVRLEGNYCISRNFDYSAGTKFNREDFVNATEVCSINFEQMRRSKSSEKSLSSENKSASSKSSSQSEENGPQVMTKNLF